MILLRFYVAECWDNFQNKIASKKASLHNNDLNSEN